MNVLDFDQVTSKYSQIKLKNLAGEVLSEKEQAILYFYENNVLKYGLSHDDREQAKVQVTNLFNFFWS